MKVRNVRTLRGTGHSYVFFSTFLECSSTHNVSLMMLLSWRINNDVSCVYIKVIDVTI